MMTEDFKKPIEDSANSASTSSSLSPSGLSPRDERLGVEDLSKAERARPEFVERVEESSLERLKRVAEELNKTGVKESRKENLIENDPSINGSTGSPSRAMPRDSGLSRVQSRDEKTPNLGIGISERPALQKGEMKIAETALSDLIQEKMKLEKTLQELNNLKSKICQRIGLIKTIEKREKELNQQLASVRKENDFSDQIKKKFENLEENIHPVK